MNSFLLRKVTVYNEQFFDRTIFIFYKSLEPLAYVFGTTTVCVGYRIRGKMGNFLQKLPELSFLMIDKTYAEFAALKMVIFTGSTGNYTIGNDLYFRIYLIVHNHPIENHSLPDFASLVTTARRDHR